MTITLQQVETVLVGRAQKIMVLVGFSVMTVGTNEDLTDPISMALRKVGVTVADITAPTNDELALVPEAKVDQFLDLAELRLWQNLLGSLDLVDTTALSRSEAWGQIAKQIQTKIDRLTERITTAYVVPGTLTGGVISLDFQYDATDVL